MSATRTIQYGKRTIAFTDAPVQSYHGEDAAEVWVACFWPECKATGHGEIELVELRSGYWWGEVDGTDCFDPADTERHEWPTFEAAAKAACDYWDNWEPRGEPDYDAVSTQERYEQAADQKRRLG